MAIDTALAAAARSRGEAYLRIYRWSEPSLTLGYFQAANERLNNPALAALPYTRRLSGGGAIVHDRELTYAMALPSGGDKAAASWLYESLHAWWRDLLQADGYAAALFRDAHKKAINANDEAVGAPVKPAFLCFERRSPVDVVVVDAKIIGSAQRRIDGAILQQGSVLLEASEAAPHLLGLKNLSTATDPTPSWHELFDSYGHRFVGAVESGLISDDAGGVQWATIESESTTNLLADAENVAADRFRHNDWLHRR